MYALDVPRSMISYRDLRANGIHISTVIEKNEEALKLWQGQRPLATAVAGVNSLYEIAIKAISPTPRVEEEVSPVAQERGPNVKAHNLAQKHSIYLTASVVSDIWHKRLGHPNTTIFRKMFLLPAGDK